MNYLDAGLIQIQDLVQGTRWFLTAYCGHIPALEKVSSEKEETRKVEKPHTSKSKKGKELKNN